MKKFFQFAALSIALIAALPVSAQWTKVALNLLNTNGFVTPAGAMTYSSGRLWAAFTDKIWVSYDDGISWVNRSPGTSFAITYDIDFFDANNGVIATTDGLYITKDGGNTWKFKDPGFGTCTSVRFIASPDEIAAASAQRALAVTRDGGLTWNTSKFAVTYRYINNIETTRSGIIHSMLICTGIANDCSQIITSSDYGDTWSYSAAGFDYDCYTFAFDPCDDKRIYVANEEIHGLTDNQRSIYVSSDAGASWQTTTTKNQPYLAGSVRVTPMGTVFAQTITSGVLRSTDQGTSWKNIGGPGGLPDTKMLAYKDDNTIFAIDSFGSVWRTTNSGGFPVTIQYDGTLAIAPSFLFDKKGVCINDSIADKITITSTGCNPPIVSNYTITDSAAGDYSVAFRDKDSIIVRFHPSSAGSRPATLVITLSDGTTLNVKLGGSGVAGGTLTVEPTILFDGLKVHICESVDGVIRFKRTGCNPPYITRYALDDRYSNYTVIDSTSDSMVIRFHPTDFSYSYKFLYLYLSDGSTITIQLRALIAGPSAASAIDEKKLFTQDTVSLCSFVHRWLHFHIPCPNAYLIAESIRIVGPGAKDYRFDPSIAGAIDMNEEDSVRLRFTPSNVGLRPATLQLTFYFDHDTQYVSIPLEGTGIDQGYTLVASPAAPFASDSCALCQTLTRKFRVRSGGCVVPRVASQSISGSAMKNYSLDASVPDPLTGDDEVTITFTPNALGAANADYTLTMADGRKLIVPLAARGYKIPYTLRFTPKDLFSRDSLYALCENSSASATVTISGCPLPKVTSENITGGASGDYLLKTKASDSLIAPYTFDITFTPSAIGKRDAEYKLVFDDGSFVSVPLLGYGLKSSKPLTLATDPAFATDTIGGLISVPIKILGLDAPRTLELIVSFDTNLQYLGTTSLAGMNVDIPATRTKKSSRIHLAPTQVNITGTSAYANFNVFADSGKTMVVSLSDLSVLDTQSPCEFAGNASVAATITGPSGCGFIAISNFLRYNRSPQFRIYPNPTNSSITVAPAFSRSESAKSRLHYFTGEITVTDAVGSVRVTQSDNPVVDLSSLPSGLYFVRVSGYGAAMPVVVGK